MFRQIITATALTLFGTPLFALCNGPSYFDRLTTSEIAEIEAISAALPYGQGTHWIAMRDTDTLTIAGTIHIYDTRLQYAIDTLRPAVQAADLILLEATLVEEAKLQNTIQSDPTVIFTTQGATLPERLDADTWDRLAQAANARGVPAPLAAKMQPWYLSIMLAMPPCALAETAAGQRGLDHLIMQAATDANVPMQALEPYDTIIKILRDGNPDEQLDILKLSIMDEQDQIAMFTAMRDSYFSQDTGKLMGLSQIIARHIPNLDADTAAKLTAESEEAMLNARNIAWMPVITAATKTHDNIFVGVGAAHLAGDQGILKLLEADGWTLTKR